MMFAEIFTLFFRSFQCFLHIQSVHRKRKKVWFQPLLLAFICFPMFCFHFSIWFSKFWIRTERWSSICIWFPHYGPNWEADLFGTPPGHSQSFYLAHWNATPRNEGCTFGECDVNVTQDGKHTSLQAFAPFSRNDGVPLFSFWRGKGRKRKYLLSFLGKT